MYIHGPFGTGKSFILGAIANQLKAKSVASTIVYLPEYIRTLKSGFRDGSYETKLQRIREANILMIDDIGAEEVTPWIRDWTIITLSHGSRTTNVFSSNLNFEELEHHLSITREGAEETKA